MEGCRSRSESLRVAPSRSESLRVGSYLHKGQDTPGESAATKVRETGRRSLARADICARGARRAALQEANGQLYQRLGKGGALSPVPSCQIELGDLIRVDAGEWT